MSQDQGFAAAARGDGDRLSAWRGGDLGDDHYAAASDSADLVARAFADVALDAESAPPELGGRFPAALAVSFHLVDLVVHAWDVAAAIGAPWEPAGDLVEASLKVAVLVPGKAGAPASRSARPCRPRAARRRRSACSPCWDGTPHGTQKPLAGGLVRPGGDVGAGRADARSDGGGLADRVLVEADLPFDVLLLLAERGDLLLHPAVVVLQQFEPFLDGVGAAAGQFG